MVSLLFILFLGGLIFSSVRYLKAVEKHPRGGMPVEFYKNMLITFGILTAVFGMWIFLLINAVGTSATIDQKIKMYEEENSRIEKSVDVIVKGYMEFEASTYTGLKDKDAISLVSLFPELKSDSLVQQQIEIYVANNQKIKGLKENKIDLSAAKWKLYFGK